MRVSNSPASETVLTKKARTFERSTRYEPGGGEYPTVQRPHPLLQTADLLCFSHLRWNFVYQRPQHLLSRAARQRRVFFFEEPVFVDGGEPRLEVQRPQSGIFVVTPHLPHGTPTDDAQRLLINRLLHDEKIANYLVWYYTPMALSFTRHLEPLAIAYDCMDELSHFKFAPPEIREREQELMAKADVVYTGGHSLFEAKRDRHRNIHPFPSSVDKAHFSQARQALPAPADQAGIAGPRIGFFGVIDERFDIPLVDRAAELRPDWQFVFLGPVVKIDPATLPRRANLHYLGGKSYAELPAYLAGWDVAILPFARNEATRFISPTKTPEYLAAGKPVVSTSISDVVTPYADLGLVRIADDGEAFAKAIEASLQPDTDGAWLRKVDLFLEHLSWEDTWQRMETLLLNSARPPARFLQ